VEREFELSFLDVFLENRRNQIVAAAAIVMIVAALMLIDLTRDVSADYGFYFSNGWFITQGLIPYEDFFTHKTPMFPVIIAGWITVFGTSLLSVWLLKMSLILSLTGTTYYTARTMGFVRSIALIGAGLTALFSASHLIEGKDHGLIVIVASIFEMLAIAWTFAIIQRRSSRKYGLAVGIAIAIGVAVRQSAAFILPFLIVALFINFVGKDRRLAINGAIWIIAGFVVTGVLLVLVYLAAGGSFSTMYDQVVSFNVVRLSGLRQNSFDLVHDWFQYAVVSSRVVIGRGIAATAVLVLGRKRPVENLQANRLLLLAMLGVGIALFAQGQFFNYYYRQVVPIGSLLVAVVFVRMSSEYVSLRDLPVVRTFVVVALVTLVFLAPMQHEFQTQLFMFREYRAAPANQGLGGHELALSKFLNSRRPEGDFKILVLGANIDEVYAYARALPASTFTNMVPLQWTGYLTDEEFDEWFAEAKASDFDIVLDRNMLLDPENPNPRIGRFIEAADELTKDLTRVEYPSDRITIHER